MKTIKLIVDGSVIKYDPDCSYEGLYKGMSEQVRISFAFSDEWKNVPKVVSFISLAGKEFPPLVLKSKSCIIPVDVLNNYAFKVRILGKLANDERIRTTTCTIYLEGGRA